MEKEQPKKSSRKPWSYGMIVAFLLMIILLPPLLHTSCITTHGLGFWFS